MYASLRYAVPRPQQPTTVYYIERSFDGHFVPDVGATQNPSTAYIFHYFWNAGTTLSGECATCIDIWAPKLHLLYATTFKLPQLECPNFGTPEILHAGLTVAP